MNDVKIYRSPEIAEIGNAEVLTLGSKTKKKDDCSGKRCGCSTDDDIIMY